MSNQPRWILELQSSGTKTNVILFLSVWFDAKVLKHLLIYLSKVESAKHKLVNVSNLSNSLNLVFHVLNKN